MLPLHVLFVSLLVGTEAFFSFLAILNLRHGEDAVDAERDWIRERLDVEDPDRLLDYQRANTGFSMLRSWVGLAGLLGVLYTGLLTDAVRLVETLPLPPVARGVAFFLGLVVVLRVAGLPFDAFGTFVVEEVFDFNEQGPRLWIRDTLVGLAIGLVITGVLATAVLVVLARFPTWWPVGAWALFVAFSLVMLVLYPRVIAPLFNDFEPLDAGELREAVESVFDRAGFSAEGIYRMDASRRSSKANAYFVGFGRTKRVVLFDTLIERMSVPEIQSVLAHELAHWRKAHVWKRLATGAVRMGVLLGALKFLVDAPWLYAMFDLPPDAVYAGLVLGALWLRPLSEFSTPLQNRLSIAHEREADAFAVEVMGEGEPLVDALCGLVGENLSNPFPHPAYAAFHYSHPPVPDRIRHIRELSR